jgi:hypothetical protein
MNDQDEPTRDQQAARRNRASRRVVVQQVYLRVQVRKATQVPTCATCGVDPLGKMGREWPVW